MRDKVRETLRMEVCDELRKEFNDKFKLLESQYAEMQVQLRAEGKNVPKSPIRKSMPVQEVSDAQSFHHLSEDPLDLLFETEMVAQLLSLELPKKVVAKDTVLSKDPTKDIEGMQLGDGFWIVRINKAILPQQTLLISRRNMRTVGQAIKRTVFWRNTDVSIK